MLGNGPVILSRNIKVDSIEKAVEICSNEIDVIPYSNDALGLPELNDDFDITQRIKIGELFTITAVYTVKEKGALLIDVQLPNGKETRHEFWYNNSLIEGIIDPQGETKIRKAFMHNGKEVIAIGNFNLK
jgi:hypothetical protein